MKKVQMDLLIITMLLSIICQGCCSLFRSSSQLIKVNSKPQGSVVTIGEAQGKAPFEITILKGKESIIKANLGDETQSQTLSRRVDGLYWVNILVWPGLIVDAITGKMWVYDPTTYSFEFKQK